MLEEGLAVVDRDLRTFALAIRVIGLREDSFEFRRATRYRIIKRPLCGVQLHRDKSKHERDKTHEV